jgi:signal transduction histidine kinase
MGERHSSGSEKGSSVFKPKARLISLLGDQLITNEVIATVELIKNSFDADATTVTLVLQNVSNQQEGEIVIEDNGTGMTLDTILNVWLEPGTEHRKIQRDKGERTTVYKRPLLGEKGIGRFAAHRLGNVINLVTKTKDSELEVEVEVNWLMFGQNKYLEDVPIHYMTRKPKIFVGEKHGTMIVIQDLKKAWSQHMAMNLAEKLKALQAPLKEKYNFEIKFVAPEFPDIEKEEKVPLEDVLATAPYSFEASVGEEGRIQALYQFRHHAFADQTRNSKIAEDIRTWDKRFALANGQYRSPSCGSFDIRLHSWDLGRTALDETVSRKYYDLEIRPHTGVRIYRDGFRVWPYGEVGNDWLSLDLRRVNNPTRCLSNNQIIGTVNIASDRNPELVDKTDREGLMENEAFEDFKCLVLLVINEFENEREKDKIRISSLGEKKELESEKTIQAIDLLKEKMQKSDNYAQYEKEIAEVENAFEAEVKHTVEPIIASAGIGLANLIPAHEILLNVRDLERLIETLKSDLDRIGVGGRITETTISMLEITRIVEDVAEGALELTHRKKGRFPLRSAVDSACCIKEPSLRKEGINVEVIEKDKVEICGQKNLLVICLLNLIENSLYWLSDIQNRVLRIVIDHDTNLNPRIIVSDNGPGIKREDLPYLGKAFWTRKPNGSGLGLHVAKKAMRVNSGEVDFGFYGENPDFLVGANIILRFKPKVELKE